MMITDRLKKKPYVKLTKFYISIICEQDVGTLQEKHSINVKKVSKEIPYAIIFIAIMDLLFIYIPLGDRDIMFEEECRFLENLQS